VRLRDSRDPRFDALRLSPLARDCIACWDDEVERRERQSKAKAGQMFELLTAFFASKG
jgi:hypothetical protein